MYIGIIGSMTEKDICFRADISVNRWKRMLIFLTVLRYIHQNPVKAGLVKDIAALPNASPKIQKEVSKYVKGLDGSSLRQLSRSTGFTVNKIYIA